MKLIYPILAAGSIAFAASLASCNDFLTEDPSGQMAPESFFKTANDLDMAVNALYFNVAQSWSNSNPCIPAVQGDDMTSTVGSNKSAYLSADAYEEPSDYKGINYLWLWQYNIIQAANPIIDNANRAETSEENINIALGNAYFWRACAYFQLVRTFGPLPLNLHNASDNNQSVLSSVEDVYAQIVDDLEKAAACNLPVSYKDRNLGYKDGCNIWISEQAVKSLQTAVYMNMAGYPLNLGTEYYKKAADKAKEVIDGVTSGKYPQILEPEWKNVYSYGNNFSAEQIVTITYYAVPGQMGAMGSNVSQFPLCHRYTKGGWYDFIPERYFWSRFPAGPRKDAVYDPMIYTYDYKDENGNVICVDWWATKDGKPYTGKNAVISQYCPMFSSFTVNADEDGNPIAAPYDYSKPAVMIMSIDQSHRFIRYSEVLCWFAESAARAGVYTAEAKAALELVQARAYAPGVQPDNSDLAEAAYREHGYEVAGYPVALVTRRSDEFRMNRLKEAWDYRRGPQDAVIVPKGTLTHSYERVNIADKGKPAKYVNRPFTYELEEDLILKEAMEVSDTWSGVNSIYQVYPPQETEKNPNIKR